MHRPLVAVVFSVAAAATVALAGCGVGNGVARQPANPAIYGARLPLPTDFAQPAAATCSFPSSKRKRLYVAGGSAQNVVRFTLPNKTGVVLNSLSTIADSVTFDHKLNMWVSELSQNRILEFAPP